MTGDDDADEGDPIAPMALMAHTATDSVSSIGEEGGFVVVHPLAPPQREGGGGRDPDDRAGWLVHLIRNIFHMIRETWPRPSCNHADVSCNDSLNEKRRVNETKKRKFCVTYNRFHGRFHEISFPSIFS